MRKVASAGVTHAQYGPLARLAWRLCARVIGKIRIHGSGVTKLPQQLAYPFARSPHEKVAPVPI
jgi:hypothetical protein